MSTPNVNSASSPGNQFSNGSGPQSSQMTVQPIDILIRAGFQQRFQQVFGCPCAFINQNDKTKILDRVFGQGNPLTYPYAWFTIQNIAANNDSYNPHPLGRRGITLNVSSNQTINTVRVMPVNFDLEVNYVTNAMEGRGSVTRFASRWLLARRFGYLKTSVDYGNLQFGIHVTLDENIPIPLRENITEQETKYDIVVHAMIHGYISEPMLGTQGKVNKINLNQGIKLANGQVVSMPSTDGKGTWSLPSQTFDFNDYQGPSD